MSDKVLLVDDDPNVLEGFKRHLRKRYDFALALGPEVALETLRDQGPFAVVVSDMRMPGQSGVELLKEVGERYPDTVRMMLTGNADQQTAVDAVNEGHIFRFLNKPCPPELLAQSLDAGIEQYRLLRAEKELLSKTLAGSIALMTEVLSMAMPQAFARAMKIKRTAHRICEALSISGAWDIEIAAMLSQLGCVSLPNSLLDKVYEGAKLSPQEAELYQAVPRVGADLVRRIPRLEGVSQMIAHQQDRFEQLELLNDEELNEHQKLGAAILKVVLDADLLSARLPHGEVVRLIAHDRTGRYHPAVSKVFASLEGEYTEVRGITIRELEVGMVFEEHLQSTAGGILVPKGQEVTETLIKRLRNFTDPDRFIRQPFQVRVSRFMDPSTVAAT